VIRKRAVAAMSLAATLAMIGLTPTIAGASSHREAPLISQDPAADNTDLYAFRDPGDQTKVDILANYIGLEQPAAGPNFNNFADDVEYRININNTGGATDDIVYRFRFHTTFNKPLASNLPLFNGGTITKPNDGNQTELTTYSVARSDAMGTRVIASGVPVAPPNIGPRSFGPTANPVDEMTAYQQVANLAIKRLPGGVKVFAGPRKDAFFADLGSIFDLVALRPLQSLHTIPIPGNTTGVDGLAGKNVHTIAIQLPINNTPNGALAPGMSGMDAAHGSIIGVYASSARRAVRVLSQNGGVAGRGGFVQVSRLGLPLVNELLIPIDNKDRWNATDPAADGANGFIADILDPIPVKLLPALYKGTFTSANTPKGGPANRPDLIKLATGQLIGAPAPGQPGAQAAADLLRVNLAVAAVPGTVANRLGALQGDPGGFPNGRRLTDDVVDIELRVLAGVLLGPPFDGPPNSVLTDGVDQSTGAGLVASFPFIGPPLAGYYQPLPGATPN
jgi:hypothetical protein